MKDGKHVIFVIDDDRDVLDTMRLVLESHDFAVVVAESAEEGLQKYKENAPDLLIVDLMMEEVDSGVWFVKELQRLGNTAPIFMLSSIGDSLSASADYSELGLAGLFQKPVEPAILLSTIRARLSKA